MKWQNIPHSFKNRHIIAVEIAKKKINPGAFYGVDANNIKVWGEMIKSWRCFGPNNSV